ncbi:MAG TPA: T9SS type A sorting domain-containing protein [Bacteroidota bacterium]|nr:T9SS type A sorting domain-containing protein [Bacteroidota bacterium]
MNRLFLFMIAGLVLLGGPVEIRGQSTEVPLSSFGVGFGDQGAAGTRVIAEVGNTAVGRSSGSGKVVLSGFIPGAFRFRAAGGSTQLYAVQDKWNMVSVPLTLGDYTKTAVYPTAVSNAFLFNGLYTAAPVLANGPGYWVKFDSAQSVSLTGFARDVDSFTVTQGWNMVGSISSPVDVTNITSNPPGIVTSNFFRFDALYVSASTVEPGRAYWVKTTVAGKLILAATGAAPSAGRIRIEDTGEMPPPPPGEELAAVVPSKYALGQNYPNPFNPTTTIRYAIPAPVHVSLRLYDVLGREAGTLVDGIQEPGYYSVELDARSLASGIYFYRLVAGGYVRTMKVQLLR